MTRALKLAGILVGLGLMGYALKSCAATTLPKDRSMHNSEDLTLQVITNLPNTQKGGQAIVLLHGWGAPGDDLVPLAQALLTATTRIFVPEAPLPHPAGGRAWWALDLKILPNADGTETTLPTQLPSEIAQARLMVQRLLRHIREEYAPNSLALVGFSQGGMLTADVALAGNPPVDRAAVLSGSLLIHSVANLRKPPAPGLRFFVSHGNHDPIVPFSSGQRLRDALVKAENKVTWHPFSGGHEIPRSVITQLQEFLRSP